MHCVDTSGTHKANAYGCRLRVMYGRTGVQIYPPPPPCLGPRPADAHLGIKPFLISNMAGVEPFS
eukprot:6757991-Prymnesium_polylepis.2